MGERGGRRGRTVLLKHWQSGQRNSPAAHCTDWPGRGKKWRLLCSCRLLSMNLREEGREKVGRVRRREKVNEKEEKKSRKKGGREAERA